VQLTIVDAFTDTAFSGNPAAVALVDEPIPDDRMQAIAAEMNLPETAFASPQSDGSYALRWFTPTVEVDLCGHATLATAHVLGGQARFHTRSGVLSCWRGRTGQIEMDFPSSAVTAEENIDISLHPSMQLIGRNQFFALVEMDNAAQVRSYVPEMSMIADLALGAVIITAASDRAGIDCVSRVFGPNVGIPEDPVTGSAHCVLAPFWGTRLDRDELVGEQASARSGIVEMRCSGERVVLGGRAISTERVELLV
jgi:predicted PhzF superfamily epimerase YddE/YHI9